MSGDPLQVLEGTEVHAEAAPAAITEALAALQKLSLIHI